MSNKIQCAYCDGTGERTPSKQVVDSFAALKKVEPATVAEFSKSIGVELTAAHHRIKRLLALHLIQKVEGSSPTQYKTIATKKR